MKTLYGAHRPDEGTVVVDGAERHFRSPADAIDAGIGMVFQHFMLADNFTVWENIVLGSEPGSPVLLDTRGARRRIRELSDRYGLDVDPDALVADLGVGDKQRVEILKVLYRGARILILDEPTAVLVPHEVDELFASLRDLTAHGSTVVFISHKLDEVLGHADAITVIRAGRTVGEVDDPAAVTAHQLAEMMVGSELPSPETREQTVRPEVVLEVRDLTVGGDAAEVSFGQLAPGDAASQAVVTQASVAADTTVPATALRALDGVSFTVHAGEIVGIAGVEGNGQTELVEAIMGLRDADGPGAARRPGPRQGGDARAPPRRPRLRPRGPPARRHGADVPALGERAARPPGGSTVRPRRLHRSRRGPRAHEAGSSPSSTSAPPASRCRRSRSPAATSRS